MFILMKVRNLEIFEIHAAYCRVLANPLRLAIMACLDKRELSVGELAEILGAPGFDRRARIIEAAVIRAVKRNIMSAPVSLAKA